ncbi:MAG: tRNA preQ1(34) S-adenosylmethionine ribosyltransferase-isomerase QueA [Deltaproteobacteria bacterium]|nr:tRNA preQ1(34) S-adenosylmethionine ribosyltransferase-isomerase QueA [Deltaproteobacteria bacterium]
MEEPTIPEEFSLDSYRYDLPGELIAQVPSEERDGSALLVLDRRTGKAGHGTFSDLPDYLEPGDCLVANETRVVPARLFAVKETGGRVELLATRFRDREFDAMFRTHRGLKAGGVLRVLNRGEEPTDRHVTVTQVHGDGTVSVEVSGDLTPRQLMSEMGRVPVPPYIRRQDDLRHELDCERYQTVYAREEGAVAAPTAGLHFTDGLLERLQDSGVKLARLTLHVGPGTFKPIESPDVREHRVGSERFVVTTEAADAVNEALDGGRRVIAVGTTVVRALESRWNGRRVEPGTGETDLYIAPGFDFAVVSGMVTNFHLPGSSLLVLISAFAGRRRILAAYREAVERRYRFYSYGDAMLIL